MAAAPLNLREIPAPGTMLLGHPDPESVHFYVCEPSGRRYSVLVSRDEIAPGDPRWHISVAGQDRKLPEWRHPAAIVHELRAGIPFVIGIPPKSWWINVHEHTLHAWELADENLIGQWRFEGRGDEPT